MNSLDRLSVLSHWYCLGSVFSSFGLLVYMFGDVLESVDSVNEYGFIAKFVFWCVKKLFASGGASSPNPPPVVLPPREPSCPCTLRTPMAYVPGYNYRLFQ